MRLEEIIRHYISPIKKFDYTLGNNYSAADIFNYYRHQAHVNEIESFTQLRFVRKFKDVVETQDQSDWLNEKAKEISSLAQRLFQTRYPQYYAQ